jgi:hypothetical protein
LRDYCNVAERRDHMATSSFYTNFIIDEEAAKIIIRGLDSQKQPLPDDDYDEKMRRGREWLRELNESIRS